MPMTNLDEWLDKNPDRETAAALDTISDCQAAKLKARARGSMNDWVMIDRLERKAEAFLRS